MDKNTRENIHCDSVITRSIFSKISTEDTPYLARHVCVFCGSSIWLIFCPSPTIIDTISLSIEPRCNDTRLHLKDYKNILYGENRQNFHKIIPNRHCLTYCGLVMPCGVAELSNNVWSWRIDVCLHLSKDLQKNTFENIIRRIAPTFEASMG